MLLLEFMVAVFFVGGFVFYFFLLLFWLLYWLLQTILGRCSKLIIYDFHLSPNISTTLAFFLTSVSHKAALDSIWWQRSCKRFMPFPAPLSLYCGGGAAKTPFTKLWCACVRKPRCKLFHVMYCVQL